MDRNQVITKAVKDALMADISPNRSPACFCGFGETDTGELTVFVILQSFLTIDEYRLLGILMRKQEPSFRLPKYGTFAVNPSGNPRCFPVSNLLVLLENVIDRPGPTHIFPENREFD